MAKKRLEKNNNAIIRKEKKAKEQGKKVFRRNNKAFICGQIEEDIERSCGKQGTRVEYYRTKIGCLRDNGEKDFIPIMIPRTIIKDKITKGKWIEVIGRIGTYRKTLENNKRYMNVSVYVSEYVLYDRKEDMEEESNENLVYLEGSLCKDAGTFSDQKVDLLVAVNCKKNWKETAFVPCIVLGGLLDKAAKLKSGDQIVLYGRFQSKRYRKKINEKFFKWQTSYEVATIWVKTK